MGDTEFVPVKLYNDTVEECRMTKELLREALGGAALQSCFHSHGDLVDPTFHCCDWAEWVHRVCEVLEIADTSDYDEAAE